MEYGCIGEHLPHSFSKEIHQRIGSYDYMLKELAPEAVGPFLERRDFKAINVTIPYKQTVLPYLDKIDESAVRIGAVNTIVNRCGTLFGYNTDFYGMQALIKKENIDLSNKKVLILGTGGTSKTAYAVASSFNAREIYKVSRTRSEGTITYQDALSAHKDAEIIINTTPVGMFPHIFEAPIDLDAFLNLEAVVDVVYNPLVTCLVKKARNNKIKAQTGLYMLVAQAVRAYEIFMDTTAPEDLTDNVFHQIFATKQNIVLIGMPGCGKTTIGKLLAEKLGRSFVDTDDLIVKKAGCEIREIFRTKGEAAFRLLESQVIREIASESNAVIATGGGAIIKKENADALKMNGKFYFLDRSPELLIPTSDRPLALNKEAILQRYRERYLIYLSASDEIVKDDETPYKVAAEIERRHCI